MPVRPRLETAVPRKLCIFVGLMSGLMAVGCNLKPPPDPNDPADVGTVHIDVIERNLRYDSRAINERVAQGEISDSRGKKILADSAEKLLSTVKLEKISPQDAWRYGDVFRAANRWEQARSAYEMALEEAKRTKNEDRRVNDSLRLAQTEAHLSEIDTAIDLARSTFDVRPVDKAPIMMAVVYEIAPPCKGKGKDLELARLVEDAIGQHEQVIVDPVKDSGKAFLIAKKHHLEVAWALAIDLYRSAGKSNLAEEAEKKLANLSVRQQSL